jgi:phosphoserine phosphatase RsbU/P
MDGRRRSRILVVDDDQGVLHAVARILGRSHDVVCAASPSEGLTEAARQRPDLAIVDIYMPQMSGFELMHQLRDGHRDIDFIIMTGDTAEPDANLIRAVEEGAFYFVQKPFDRRVLMALVSRCLELRRLRHVAHKHAVRMERELADARKFQLTFLPDRDARVGPMQIAAHYSACQELAGDLFDYAAAGEQRVALLVADVVGHGASAAMMTGVVKSAFQTTHTDGFRTSSIVANLRSSLLPFEDTRFVTVFTALIDLAEHSLCFANAGHPPAVQRHADGSLTLLEATGTVLGGAMADFPCGTRTVPFQAEDVLFVYTDGVAEAEGERGMFGHDRVRSLVGQSRLRGRPLVDAMLRELTEFTGGRPCGDDVTMLTIAAAGETRASRAS